MELTCLSAAKEVLVNVWPGWEGFTGIWPTGVTLGVQFWPPGPPPPVNWAMNSLVKSSAFIADPAVLLFKILSHSLGASDLGWGGGSVPSLKKIIIII